MNNDTAPPATDGDQPEAHLEVRDMSAGYFPNVPIVRNVCFSIHAGEMLCVIGPNGAGKSTLLRGMLGLTRWSSGEIRLNEAILDLHHPSHIVQKGISLVLQGHQVFPDMTVEENLQMGLFAAGSKLELSKQLNSVIERLPMLAPLTKRVAGKLSGGQQQIVSIGRSLMTQPRFLLVDEPTAGLAPNFVDIVFKVLAEVRQAGIGVVLAEQNARRALEASNRALVLDLGRRVAEGSASAILADERIRQLYVGGTGVILAEAAK